MITLPHAIIWHSYSLSFCCPSCSANAINSMTLTCKFCCPSCSANAIITLIICLPVSKVFNRTQEKEQLPFIVLAYVGFWPSFKSGYIGILIQYMKVIVRWNPVQRFVSWSFRRHHESTVVFILCNLKTEKTTHKNVVLNKNGSLVLTIMPTSDKCRMAGVVTVCAFKA